MKSLKITRPRVLLTSLVVAVLFLFAAIIIPVFYHPGSVLTTAQVLKRFEAVGGVERVNAEAVQAFLRFGENEVNVVMASDRTDFPALSGLGEVLVIYPEVPGFPCHIRIPLGNHWHRQFIYILSTNSTTSFTERPSAVQLYPNVYFFR
jgi:hypothetical protein